VERYAAESRRWAALYASDLAPARLAFGNERSAKRRLRIGYVAPSFTKSQLRQFVMPVLEAHDVQAVEMFLYSADPAAELALPASATVRGVTGVSDEALAAQIRKDRIDILVDLWGHTAGSRLGVFARRPAPVQLAWVNFVQTTGLTAIDYVLHCDSMAAPGDAALFTETIWRTGEIIAPYRPADDRPEPTPTPALASGAITFGSFNNPMKLSDATVAAWAAILLGRPGSTLVLKYGPYADPVLQRAVQARFAAHGVDAAQLQFRGHSSGPDYLREFQDIDLALDPSPCPGGTTTCDALANGVPVLTLAGPDFYSRIGLNAALACGLPDLIAQSWDDYVAKALALTADIDALDALRSRVRPGFEASAFRDEAGFTRRLEADYRRMFEIWLSQ
jgi:protein O-GlcNAc transferase